VVTDPELSLEQRQAQVSELRQAADTGLAELRAKITAVKDAQALAMTATGAATSRDGSVTVTVDATGVVTSMTFAPSAFQRSTPQKLAQTAVATIQTAAAQARAKAAEALAPLRSENSPVVSAVTQGLPELRSLRTQVPDVPRTQVDPTGTTDQWAHASESDPRAETPRRQTEPAATAPPSHSQEPRHDQRPGSKPAPVDDDDLNGPIMREDAW
jgi:DNA-binding protein YbaB